MAPILSHTSEYIWRTVLKNPKTIFDEHFPDKAKVDSAASLLFLDVSLKSPLSP
jgi:hypothetical protein